MEQNNIPLTEFDTLVSPKELNILKASLPYINSNGRKLLSIYVKFKELSNTMKLLSKDEALSICSHTTTEKPNMNQLIDSIKIYLDKNELDMVNNYLNTMNTISMYSEYMNIMNKMDEE